MLTLCYGNSQAMEKREFEALANMGLDLSNPNDGSYFALRCSALSAAQFRVLYHDLPIQKMAKELHEKFFVAAVKSYFLGSNEPNKRELEELADKVLIMTNHYSEIMDQNYQETGSHFDGSDITENDTKDCSVAGQDLTK
tara:strand:- start:4955 stop:5374 length:420 start_codon:yes stop_codon:yes gene_type:complete